MTRSLNGGTGIQYLIESNHFAEGGEGFIHRIVNKPNNLAKILKDEILKSPTVHNLENKLKYLIQNPIDSEYLNYTSWPVDIVYDGGKFVGFVMRTIDIENEIDQIYSYAPGKPNFSFKNKVKIAKNLCYLLDGFHKKDYVFGDFNHNNISANNKGLVSLLDINTIHINDQYRCEVIMDGYSAPEIIRLMRSNPHNDLSNVAGPTFTKESDRFAIAIHIFRLLNNGFTPFNGIAYNSTISRGRPGIGDDAIYRNNCCFKPGNKPLSPATPPIGTHTKKIDNYFNQAFDIGHFEPQKRPTAKAWFDALDDYLKLLVDCPDHTLHQYGDWNSSCPWREADERYWKQTNGNPIPHRNRQSPTQVAIPISSPTPVQTHPISSPTISTPLPPPIPKSKSIWPYAIFLFIAVAIFAIVNNNNTSNTPNVYSTAETTWVQQSPAQAEQQVSTQVVPSPTETTVEIPTTSPAVANNTIQIIPIPSSYSCNDINHVQLKVGMRVVVGKYDLNLRKNNFYNKSNPISDDTSLGVLHEGQKMIIINGPKCFLDGTWWYVEPDNYNSDGWVREYSTNNSDYYVLPDN